jgi:hypothetical protein
MEIEKQDVQKENFIIFMDDKEIVHITKYISIKPINEIKAEISKIQSKEKKVDKIISKLVESRSITVVVEPSSRFLTVRCE